MLKKTASILLLFSALAIMLGHNFIPHHHHDFDHNLKVHLHNDGSQHNNDSQDNNIDLVHFFSQLHHDTDGQTYLTTLSSSDHLLKNISHFAAIFTSETILNKVIIGKRQKVPPYKNDHHFSQNSIPYGLRAPPVIFV